MVFPIFPLDVLIMLYSFSELLNIFPECKFVSTASGALVVGGVRDICIMYYVLLYIPEIGLSVQWSRTNQSVAVCGSLW